NIEVLSSNEVSNQHKKTKYNNICKGSAIRSWYFEAMYEEGIRVKLKHITEEQAKNNLVFFNILHNESQQLELCQYFVD
ncbi:20955_t:CDS:2, partial [Gigaspora margarita]